MSRHSGNKQSWTLGAATSSAKRSLRIDGAPAGEEAVRALCDPPEVSRFSALRKGYYRHTHHTRYTPEECRKACARAYIFRMSEDSSYADMRGLLMTTSKPALAYGTASIITRRDNVMIQWSSKTGSMAHLGDMESLQIFNYLLFQPAPWSNSMIQAT